MIWDIDFGSMLNRPLASVELNRTSDMVTFVFQDGGTRSFSTEGDCCSHSWVEHLELPNDLAGALIFEVVDSAPVTSDHDAHDEENGGDSIGVYNTAFRTSRGDVVLEFRNSSNGYYGGWLTDAGETPPAQVR